MGRKLNHYEPLAFLKRPISFNEKLGTIGVFNNYYYNYYYYNGSNKLKLVQINLDDNFVEELCEIPNGIDKPQMCDDKILFTDLPVDCVNLGYYYYDIPTDTIVTIIEPNNSTSRYTEPFEPIRYSYFIHNNMFYVDYYFDVITRMNIDTKEEFLQLIQKPNGNGSYRNEYDWISYNEYCAIHDENPE